MFDSDTHATFPGLTNLDWILRISPGKSRSSGGQYTRDDFFAWPLPTAPGQRSSGKSPSPCNVVVLGKPGTGKSTLALELAARLRTVEVAPNHDTQPAQCLIGGPNPASVLYYSLEQPPESLRMRARGFDPKDALLRLGPTREQGLKAVTREQDFLDGVWRGCRRTIKRSQLRGPVTFEKALPGDPSSQITVGFDRAPDSSTWWLKVVDVQPANKGGSASRRLVADLIQPLTPCAKVNDLVWLSQERVKESLPTFPLEGSNVNVTVDGITADEAGQSADGIVVTVTSVSNGAITATFVPLTQGPFEKGSVLSFSPEGKASAGFEFCDDPKRDLPIVFLEYPPFDGLGACTVLVDRETDDKSTALAAEPLKPESQADEQWVAVSKNVVWFPELSPRKLEQTGEKPDDASIFWERYEEIRNLIDEFRSSKGADTSLALLPPLRMVVIDSLNVFGDRPTTRYLIEQLFQLFTERNLIGVCIAEDPEAAVRSALPEPHVSPGVANLADVVIKLDWSQEDGYSHRTIEIVKSRHTENVYGPQNVKLRNRGLEVYPTLHRWYTRIMDGWTPAPTERAHNRAGTLNVVRACGPGDSLDDTIHKGLPEKEIKNIPSLVHTVLGGRNTRKTRLALSYAAAAVPHLSRPDVPRFLLVCFDLSEHPGEWLSASSGFLIREVANRGEPRLVLKPGKGVFREVELTQFGQTREQDRIATGCQLWLAPGYLLAEEFVYLLHQALSDPWCRRVNRVIFRDLAQVSANYPLMGRQLREHGTSMRVIMQLCRAHRADCMFVCGTAEKASRKIGRSLAAISHMTYTSIRDTVPETNELAKDSVLTLGGRLFSAPPDRATWTVSTTPVSRPTSDNEDTRLLLLTATPRYSQK